jgi:hypothetical protein
MSWRSIKPNPEDETMTISTLTPRSRPWLSHVSLAEACVLGLTTWWLLRELDRFRRRLPARNPRRVADSSDGQSLALSIIDTRADELKALPVFVLHGITGTTIDDGGQVKTSPPRMQEGGSGKSIARFTGLTIRYIRSPQVKADGVVAALDAQPT